MVVSGRQRRRWRPKGRSTQRNQTAHFFFRNALMCSLVTTTKTADGYTLESKTRETMVKGTQHASATNSLAEWWLSRQNRFRAASHNLRWNVRPGYAVCRIFSPHRDRSLPVGCTRRSSTENQTEDVATSFPCIDGWKKQLTFISSRTSAMKPT